MIPSELQPLANHLWQSTLFAAFAGLLALTLRQNRAQSRYSLWLAASVKLLVPFSILVDAGGHFARHSRSAIPQSELSFVVEQVSQPFAPSVFNTMPPAPPPSFVNLIPAIFFVVWAVGFTTLVLAWWMRWRRMRVAVAMASPLHLPVNLKVKTSPAFPEPAVFGIVRPVLLLPAGITSHLTPAQLEAVLAHELCHVRRRDNLAAAVHMTVEAVFWFYPLVWWLGARLIEERERACDEEVLRVGTEPAVYAEGILKICELYLESPLRFVAGVTGGNLTKRIEAIMTHRGAPRLSVAKKVTLAAAGMAALAAPVGVGMMNAPSISFPELRTLSLVPAVPSVLAEPAWKAPPVLLAQAKPPASAAQAYPAAPAQPSFEVATIKPAGTAEIQAGIVGIRTGHGSATGTNVTLKRCIIGSFHVGPHQIIGGPNWLDSDSFHIEAKAEQPTNDDAVLDAMLRGLLADRFHLVVHREMRTMPALVLEVGKNGPKLEPGDGGDAVTDASHGRMKIRNESMDDFAERLARVADLPVLNGTGLPGLFNLKLVWTPDADHPKPDGPPSLVTAIQEQLGLRLRARKSQVKVLVIDHAEKPTEN